MQRADVLTRRYSSAAVTYIRTTREPTTDSDQLTEILCPTRLKHLALASGEQI